ncbi:MAG: PIN domain-containing protein [Armatimonadetes bacterium]|nr:PIN domain-containing protein [Armatimonadota bacterium]
MSKPFVDTNVIVYANDPRAELVHTGGGVVSTHVLCEFSSAALTKLRQPVDEVLRHVAALERLTIVVLTPAIILRGVELSGIYRISFWDACILAAAEFAECDLVYSEDLNPGQLYAGIPVVNPFTSR